MARRRGVPGRAKAVYLAAGLLALSGVAALLVVLAPWRERASEATIRLRPDDPEVVARGAALYDERCASCHGVDLEGQADWRRRRADGRLPAPPHDASGHTWHHSDAQLFALTKRGPAALVGEGYQSDMPGFEGTLGDAEILAVLSYIKSRWPDPVRRRHDEVNAAARR